MFNRLFGRKKSKDTVKDRLKLVLQYDRAKLSPGKMDELKVELVAGHQQVFFRRTRAATT